MVCSLVGPRPLKDKALRCQSNMSINLKLPPQNALRHKSGCKYTNLSTIPAKLFQCFFEKIFGRLAIRYLELKFINLTGLKTKWAVNRIHQYIYCMSVFIMLSLSTKIYHIC